MAEPAAGVFDDGHGGSPPLQSLFRAVLGVEFEVLEKFLLHFCGDEYSATFSRERRKFLLNFDTVKRTEDSGEKRVEWGERLRES